jgi:hypothetical protein
MIKTLKDQKKKKHLPKDLKIEPVSVSIKEEVPPPSLGTESSSDGLPLTSSTSSFSLDSPRASASSTSLDHSRSSSMSLNKQEVKGWSIPDVAGWMTDEGFAEFVPQFEKNLIDGEALMRLDADTLKELGMDLVGIRLK